MKVWIVEHGQYSDRHVVAVMDSEVAAVEIAVLDDSAVVTSYELNEIGNRLLQGVRRWRVSFLKISDECLEAEEDYSPYDLSPYDLSPREPRFTSFPNAPSHSRPIWEFYVDARNKDEAIKIASEQRRQLLATAK